MGSLLADLENTPAAEITDPDAILTHLTDSGVKVTTWQGWERLDAHELALGASQGRERIKDVPRKEMLKISHG